MALTDKLSAIGEAIRAKTGGTELLTLDEMPTEIAAIQSGGGNLPEEALTITGNCDYKFYRGGWDWFIHTYGKQIKTKDITTMQYMFNYAELAEVPFELNLKANTNISLANAFQNCYFLEEVPTFSGMGKVSDIKYAFYNCYRLKEIPDEFEASFDWSVYENAGTTYDGYLQNFINNCYSLRKFPISVYRHANPKLSVSSYSVFNGFSQCVALDEIVGFPLPFTVNWTSNMFGSSFSGLGRIKNFTFETIDGQPKVMNWKSQTLDFSTSSVGYIIDSSSHLLPNYNSGITDADKVTDAASYEALKDSPNWWTTSEYFSRYNHDSAVATINSLPDTSAYLASAGGTNTIKFKGIRGRDTDGGAINTLTEEEIAVATAKGWTITLV